MDETMRLVTDLNLGSVGKAGPTAGKLNYGP
jgi:hypothetical protein